MSRRCEDGERKRRKHFFLAIQLGWNNSYLRNTFRHVSFSLRNHKTATSTVWTHHYNRILAGKIHYNGKTEGCWQ